MDGGKPGARSALVVLQEMARGRLRMAIEVATAILDDLPLEAVRGRVHGQKRTRLTAEELAALKPVKYTVEDKMRAAEFLRRMSGADRAGAPREARTHFGVLRKSEAEAVEVVGQ